MPDLATAEIEWLLLRADVGVVRTLTRGHHGDGGGAVELGRTVIGFTEGAVVPSHDRPRL